MGRSNFKKKKTVLQNAKNHKGANAQSKQIVRLARSVDILKDNTRELTIPVNWTSSYSSRTDAYPLVVPLTSGPRQGAFGVAQTNNTPIDRMDWVKWGTYPGATINSQKGNLKLYSQYVDMILEPGGEPSLLNHTIFVVQLRDDNAGLARATYIRTTGMTNLTDQVDFVTNIGNPGSQAWLNPQLYKIHKRYEMFTIGDTTADVDDAIMRNHSGGYNRVNFKLTYGGRHLKSSDVSSEVGSITYDDIDPEYKYFIVAFSDNSTVDLENPLLSVCSTIHTRMF